MLRHLPNVLLFSRPVFIGGIALMTITRSSQANAVVLGLMAACLITDILDGIIARQLNVSTTQLRVLDTIFDLIFYLCVLNYVYSVDPGAIENSWKLLFAILGMETLLYLISLLRFGKFPSPHAFLSKVWGLYLVVEFFLLILQVEGNHFEWALYFGLIVHVDRLLIYVLLKTWDHDIPSCYHAWLLRNGKTITRHKLLNG